MRYVIPLTPEPQRFSIVLAGRELLSRIVAMSFCEPRS